MHYAIIAAGEGSRLQQEGIKAPKPLVSLAGLTLVDRLLGILLRCHAESVSVICRTEMSEVRDHLHQYQEEHPLLDLRLIDASTPSSMHSLVCLAAVIPQGKVCVMTVDTVFREADFARFVSAFEASDCGLFAVTPFVDDEKPLWVATDAHRRITAFCDSLDAMPADAPRLVSGGIYGLDTRWAWPVLQQCIAEGQSRMRNYQRALVSAGVQLQAYVFDQIMDIDHAEDLCKAEAWLQAAATSKPRHLLAVGRIASHSPNCEERDAMMLATVCQLLGQQGYQVETIGEEQLCAYSHEQLCEYDVIISMSRLMASYSKLQQAAASTTVINDPHAVIHVAKSRELTLTCLQQAGIDIPAWWAYDAEVDEMFQCEPHLQQLLPGWVKALREHGAQPGDVAWVETPLQADSHIMELAAQNVLDIVVTRHVIGDLLKVYAVVDHAAPCRTWLSTFYPQESGYSKFGEAEQHNTDLQHNTFDRQELSRLVWQVSDVLSLDVFGIDVIVQPDGKITVIDVNDWPSFSTCRDAAARAIVSLINDRSR